MKKNIYDIALNRKDTQIAIVENQGMFDSVQESIVRLYDVGRRRDDEDELVSFNVFFLKISQTMSWKMPCFLSH